MTPLRLLQRFLRRENGSAAAEVAILFPLLVWPFMMTMEAGFMQMRRVMFERAIDVVARELRMGSPDLDTPEKIKAAICDATLVMADCRADLMLEMRRVEVRNFTPPASGTRCVDREEEVNPVLNFTPGQANEMMMMRFCVLHDPILPGTGIGAGLERQPGGGVAIVASTFFVNEP